MKLNAGKTKTMTVSRSRTIQPLSPPLSLGGVELKNLSELVILGVTWDSKLLLEKHVRSISKSAFRKLGIMRRSWQFFRDWGVLRRCFSCFILPVLEYCSAVWCSAADCHLRLLDRVVSNANFLVGGTLRYDLGHRRSVAALCMLYKIWDNSNHPLNAVLPPVTQPARFTRGTRAQHRYAFGHIRCRTEQSRRSFLPWTVFLWNGLPSSVFNDAGLSGFKSRVNKFLLTGAAH